MKACLLGKILQYSFSKQIHERLGTEYCLHEIDEKHLQHFVESHEFCQFNVTIPYKQSVIPFLDRLDNSAVVTGAVNTVLIQNGVATGYNTDIDGLEYLFARKNVDLYGKNVVVLGTGGTSKTTCALLKRKNAAKVTVVGRTSQWNYSNYPQLTDTQILVNTTPVGTYPVCNQSAVDLTAFPNLEFVADVVYNPLKTQLQLQSEKLGVAFSGGLSMLVRQAVRAEEIWQNKNFDGQTEQILQDLQRQLQNVVLVGMPASGKTTVGKIVSEKLGKKFVDLDEEVQNVMGQTPAQIIENFGEDVFRNAERSIAEQFSLQNGLVIATGGGTVLRQSNRDALRRNGFVVWLQRDLQQLSTEGRPISQQKGLKQLFEERKGLYQAAADISVQGATAEDAANLIVDAFLQNIGKI